uniref:Uncharacterized protein n=1 Tax=Clytia hemisphaerica TaxID=252671 RepID=A0A7M5WUT3_9CNID
METSQHQPIFIIQPQRTERGKDGSQMLWKLGVIQIVIGCISILSGIAMVFYSFFGIIGAGIWSGAWFFTTGIIGVTSARKPANRCLHWTNMSFNIFSSVMSIALAFTFLCFGMLENGGNRSMQLPFRTWSLHN